MKKLLCLLLALLMCAGTFSLAAFAAGDAVVYLDNVAGNDDNDGMSADAPK